MKSSSLATVKALRIAESSSLGDLLSKTFFQLTAAVKTFIFRLVAEVSLEENQLFITISHHFAAESYTTELLIHLCFVPSRPDWSIKEAAK